MISDKEALQRAFVVAEAFLAGCGYKADKGLLSGEDIDIAVTYADMNLPAKFDSETLYLRLLVKHFGKEAVENWGVYEQSADPVAAMLSKFI